MLPVFLEFQSPSQRVPERPDPPSACRLEDLFPERITPRDAGIAP